MIGRGYAQFKRAFEDIKDTVDLDLDLDNNRQSYKKSKTSINEIYREKWEDDIAKVRMLSHLMTLQITQNMLMAMIIK